MSESTRTPAGILVVTIDRLPAWILPAYGSTWVSTPAIDNVAGGGLVFDRVIARSDRPLDTLFDLAGRGPETAAGWPLLTTAAEAGWSPTVVTDDTAFAESLPPGVAIRLERPATATEPAGDDAQTGPGRLFADAAEAAASPDCRLLWCHAAGLGVAWDAPEEYRGAYLDPDDPPPPPGAEVPEVVVDAQTDPDLVVSLRHVFAAQVSLFDTWLGRLLDVVAARSPTEPWTILLAGTRGIGLGLHGRIGRGPLPPFGELVHLPAILVDHRARMAAQRYGGLVLPADIGATLLDLAGSAPVKDADPRAGRSLLGLFDDWQGPDRDRIVCATEVGTAIATPAWHLVAAGPQDGSDAPPAMLYAKPDDFFEVCDVADRCPEVAEELAGLARRVDAEPGHAWSASLSASALGGV
jgi:arylsulfatase A-like enzyme